MLTQKSYRLTDPQMFASLDQALSIAEEHPRVSYQIEELENYDLYGNGFLPDLEFRLWRVVFIGPRCPICGLADGTTHPGAPDPRRVGGPEHICWKCADKYKRFIERSKACQR